MLQCTRSSSLNSTIAKVLFLAVLGCVGASSAFSQSNDTVLTGQRNGVVVDLDRQLQKVGVTMPPTEADRTKIRDAAKFVLRVANKTDLYAVALSTRMASDPAVAQVKAQMDAASRLAVNKLKADVDEVRVDKQVGSASSSAGSTSLTTKGSVPAILGFAVENGALESSSSGTSITFTGRPVQIIQALQDIGWTEGYKVIEKNPGLGFLNRFSFGLTFDASRTGQNSTFTGNANQISDFTFHVDIVNHRDPRDKRYDKDYWEPLQHGVAQEMALNTYQVNDKILTSEAYGAVFNPWLDTTLDNITDAILQNGTVKNNDALNQVLDQRLAAIPLPSGPTDPTTIAAFAQSTQQMLDARKKILDFVGTAPIFTFDYTLHRATPGVAPQPTLPDTSNFKLIFEFAPIKGGSFTSNGAVTIFNSQPQTIAANRIRDAQFSSQLDVPVAKSIPKIGNVVLSFAGKYEFIPDDVLTPATNDTIFGPGLALRGNIGLGQAKLTIPVKGSGVKIPLSLTVSNRTELIKENDVRGNIGITFDLDSIIGRLKP
jgi:hypothetical protein